MIKIGLIISNIFGIVPNVDLKIAFPKIMFIGRIKKTKIDYVYNPDSRWSCN